MRKNFSKYFIFFGWTIFGQILISLVFEGYLYALSDFLLIIGQFFPSISRMGGYVFFDLDIARRYTVLMLFSTPAAVFILNFFDIRESFSVVSNFDAKRVAIIYFFMASLPIFFGFGYSILEPFLRSFILYAFFTSSFVLFSAYCIRSGVYLLHADSIRGE